MLDSWAVPNNHMNWKKLFAHAFPTTRIGICDSSKENDCWNTLWISLSARGQSSKYTECFLCHLAPHSWMVETLLPHAITNGVKKAHSTNLKHIMSFNKIATATALRTCCEEELRGLKLCKSWRVRARDTDGIRRQVHAYGLLAVGTPQISTRTPETRWFRYSSREGGTAAVCCGASLACNNDDFFLQWLSQNCLDNF